MDTTSVQSMAKTVAGQAQQLASEVLGNPATRLAGKAKVICGKSQEALNQAALATRDNIAEKPATAMGIAVAIGFALGLAWSLKHK